MTRHGSRVSAAIAEQALIGVVMLVSVLAIGYLTLSGARLPGRLEWLVGAYVLVALIVCVHSLRAVRARFHGRDVEDRAAREAVDVLPKFGVNVVALGLPVPGLGDIDIVAGRAERRMPVEIKSFHTWEESDRCLHARTQVTRQMAALRANHGIVWLPDARAGWWRRWRGLAASPDVTVAFGSARNLARVARRWL
ncbi:MAG: hypothetical protein EPN36_14240 [Rhodanobacteraceae bacterium]|nr:MAG: hypothetical protein EPN36_14240 [Rhodanobacteraceae bacterium]